MQGQTRRGDRLIEHRRGNAEFLPLRRHGDHLFAEGGPGIGRQLRLDVDLDVGSFGLHPHGERVLLARLVRDGLGLQTGIPEVRRRRGKVHVQAGRAFLHGLGNRMPASSVTTVAVRVP